MASPRAVVAEASAEAPAVVSRIPISPETFSAIASENEALRKAVLSLEGDKRVLQHALLRAHERYDATLAGMQEQLNEVALAASLVPGMAAHADQMAQKVQALWSERELALLDRRTPEQAESLNDAREAARAHG